VRTFFEQRAGSSNVDVRTFWHKKLRIFQNLWCVRTDKGLSQCGHFAYKRGGGQFFAILCGRLFWTAPKFSSFIKISSLFMGIGALWVNDAGIGQHPFFCKRWLYNINSKFFNSLVYLAFNANYSLYLIN